MTVVSAVLQLLASRDRRGVGRSEGGNSVVEYAMIVALIAVVCLAALAMIGDSTAASLSRTASTLR